MAKADLIEQQVEDIVTGLLQGQDEIELVDVEYVKEHDWYLRIYIDRADGIDIEDCQALSEKVEQVLDEQDLISDPYILGFLPQASTGCCASRGISCVSGARL